MQFPEVDEMTEEQAVANEAARQDLVPGQYYRFDPPVKATAVPTGGPSVCALEECTFDRGWYLGFKEGKHLFQGKPTNDQRVIPIPRDYKEAPNPDEIREKLRESYFHILFIGGSQAKLDSDQSHR